MQSRELTARFIKVGNLKLAQNKQITLNWYEILVSLRKIRRTSMVLNILAMYNILQGWGFTPRHDFTVTTQLLRYNVLWIITQHHNDLLLRLEVQAKINDFTWGIVHVTEQRPNSLAACH